LGLALHGASLAGATLVFLDGAGPPLGLALHRARVAGAMLIFPGGAGPPLGLALHGARVAGAMLIFPGGAGPSLGLAFHGASLARAALVFPGGAGPSLGLALHGAQVAGAMLIFPGGAGPSLHGARVTGTLALFTSGLPLGLALHSAGLAFVHPAARFSLRRTLGSICAAGRTFHALLGRGQAAAGDQSRSCDRSQQTLSHLGLSFTDGELPNGLTPPPKDGSRFPRIRLTGLSMNTKKLGRC
jgi:hypothetical protein